MTPQRIAVRGSGAPLRTSGGAGYILPVRLDGEPVTDPAFALPLPADFIPWEQLVEAYMATYEPARRRVAA